MSITLSVPKGYELPDFYTHADPPTVSDALTIGASLYDILHKKHTDDRIQELEAHKAAEIDAIRAAAAAQIQCLNEQMDALRVTQAQRLKELADAEAVATAAARHDEAERLARINTAAAAQIQYLNEQMAALRATQAQRLKELAEAEAAATAAARYDEAERLTRIHTQRISALQTELLELQERNAALAARRTELEATRDTDIARAEDSTRTLLQLAMDEKQRSLERLEREKDRLAALLERQTLELQALNEFIRRKPATTNVKTKGSDFEAAFRDRLVAAYGVNPRFSLEDSAHNGVGHAGDFKMKWGEHTVLWECKDYDKPVPAAEVDKFKRDMKENSDVRAGVMVSRFTSIVGKTASGDRHVEFLDGKMYVYLSQFETMSEDTLKNLMPLFQFWWESDRNTESEESRITAIHQVEKLYGTAVKARTEWRVHKSRMEEVLRWMAETVEESEHRLQQALNVLNGAVAVLTVPPGIFRCVDGDERATQLVQIILEFVEPGPPTASVLMNDLAEHVARRQVLSASTAKTHIRSVLLDDVLDTPKGKPTRIRGVVFRTTGGGGLKNVLTGNV
jgi:hypothetical protein